MAKFKLIKGLRIKDKMTKMVKTETEKTLGFASMILNRKRLKLIKK